MAVGLAVFPASAVRAPVVEVETSPVDVSLGRSGGACGARGRGGRAVAHGVVSWLLHLLNSTTLLLNHSGIVIKKPLTHARAHTASYQLPIPSVGYTLLRNQPNGIPTRPTLASYQRILQLGLDGATPATISVLALLGRLATAAPYGSGPARPWRNSNFTQTRDHFLNTTPLPFIFKSRITRCCIY